MVVFTQVCQSAEDYQAYDLELGLCVCREPPVSDLACLAGRCGRGQGAELMLKCLSSGGLQLVWSERVSDARVKDMFM